MKNLFSIYTVEKSLTLFPWVWTGGSTAWIHSAGSWYHGSYLSPSSKPGVVYLHCSTVGVLKRKDVFIEPLHVRCVWSLMSPVTFMWHSIKDGEADKLCNEPTCFGQEVNCDVAAGLAVLWKEFAIWNDVKMSQTPSITLSQQRSAKEKVIWAMAEGILYLFFSALQAGKSCFLSQRGHIALKRGSQNQWFRG